MLLCIVGWFRWTISVQDWWQFRVTWRNILGCSVMSRGRVSWCLHTHDIIFTMDKWDDENSWCRKHFRCSIKIYTPDNWQYNEIFKTMCEVICRQSLDLLHVPCLWLTSINKLTIYRCNHRSSWHGINPPPPPFS